MNRITAKIAIEIRMLFQHDDIDSGAREKKARHHSGRATADDDAAGPNVGRIRDQASTDCRRGMPRPSKIVRVASDLLSV